MIQPGRIQCGYQHYIWMSASKAEVRGKMESTPSLWEVVYLLLLMSHVPELGDPTYFQGRLGNEIIILGICPTPHPNCQMCPKSNPFSPLPCFDYGPSHHPSPLNDCSSHLTGFPAPTLALTWNLHSAQNESFRSPIFNFFTQNSPMAGETLRMRFLLPVTFSPPLSPTPATLASSLVLRMADTLL